MKEFDELKLDLYFRDVDKIYDENIKYKNYPNTNLLILFSGIPGSGKSYIAKLIEGKFKGLLLESHNVWDKAIQPLYEHSFNLEDRNKVLNFYIKQKLTDFAELKNGLIILDRSMDRHFSVIGNWAKDNSYPIFLISLDTPRTIIEKRIQSRSKSKNNPEDYLNMLDKWTNDWKKFNAEHSADVTIHSDNFDEGIKETFSLIREKLNTSL